MSDRCVDACHRVRGSVRCDRVGAWTELALKAATKALPPDKPDQQQKPNAAPQLVPPSVAEPERSQIRTQAELVLIHDPLNARALRILGQLAASAGDEAKASKLMQAAAHRSHRQSVAIYWLMREHFEKKDYAAALHYADASPSKQHLAPTGAVRLATNRLQPQLPQHNSPFEKS